VSLFPSYLFGRAARKAKKKKEEKEEEILF